MNVAALIVAAGKGSRLGAPLPKQYLPLGDSVVLRRTVKAFLDHPGVGSVQVVISPADRDLYESALGDIGLRGPVDGGDTRQQSVYKGLQALSEHGAHVVLIHDAARPFVSAAQISQCLMAAEEMVAVVPVVPVVDSVKLVAGDELRDEVDRDSLRRTQTPQTFDYQMILQAHRLAVGQNLTDDAAVARFAGETVTTVPGDEGNFKITTADDLERARMIITSAERTPIEEYRTGTGFDVHRYASGRPMIICGVEIPHDLGLEGHSDADVGLHAITDAVLGALAEGDIGDHFPPTDPQWRGAPSDVFLDFAGQRVTQRGGRIASIDVTIICETPKIKPHRQTMRDRIAHILGVGVDRVSVKATTTERLGFTGRREGIAAQAIATVALPTSLK
jgi:2-C-methyl-D-erythritol 4-phosphate cytidylyltransferase/2-C-methyl-D-erythritol 2,4-cyclodiphosphate synthase